MATFEANWALSYAAWMWRHDKPVRAIYAAENAARRVTEARWALVTAREPRPMSGLICGDSVPCWVEVDRETAYGRTARLSRSIRVF